MVPVRKERPTFGNRLGRSATISVMDTQTRIPQAHIPAGRVLVVEDDAAVLMMLVEVLRERGFCVAGAARPELAYPLIDDFRPQIVVIGTDGRGTFERGWRLAALLRQHLPDLPLLMVSTSDAAVAEFGITPRGRLFDAALLKPFRIQELVTQLQRHLQWSLFDEPGTDRSCMPAVA